MSRFCLSQILSHSPASKVRSSRTEDGSALGSNPAGFTDFVGSAVSLSGKDGLLCSSCKLLKLLFLFDVRPFPPDGSGTSASADSCQFSLISQSGFPVFRSNGRSPQIRTLTFSASLSHLLLRPLIAWASLLLANSPSLTASYRLLVHQVADLPPASSRPHLAVTPLPSANGWCNQPP